ncbi:MAG TPA: hypothetical protein VLX44_18675 [Xanthobacteraceae bacterium]|nr:hypothetical protein [Xanthobacteraceae bacterium]
MAEATENWSNQRRVNAQRVSAILYGIIGIMTAELSVQPGEFPYGEAALGALFVGLAMYVAHVFVLVVKVESELGAHLPLGKARAVALDSLMVLLFPGATALLIVVAALVTARWTVLLDAVLYLGMAAVFATGFMSSYVLDRAAGPALRRALVWLLLSLLFVAAKSLA